MATFRMDTSALLLVPLMAAALLLGGCGGGAAPRGGTGGSAPVNQCLCAGCVPETGAPDDGPPSLDATGGAPGTGGAASSGTGGAAPADGGSGPGIGCPDLDPVVSGNGPRILAAVGPTVGVSWTASNQPGQTGAGFFDNPASPQTYFNCTAPGAVTISASFSCGGSFSTTVSCASIVFPPDPAGCPQLTSLTEPSGGEVGQDLALEAGTSAPSVTVSWALGDPALATLHGSGRASSTLTCQGVGVETVSVTASCPSCVGVPAGCAATTTTFDVHCCGLAVERDGVVAASPSGATLAARYRDPRVTESWTLSDPSLGTLNRADGESATFTCRSFGDETITVTARLPGADDAACATEARSFTVTCDELPDGTARPDLCPFGVNVASHAIWIPVGLATTVEARAFFAGWPNVQQFPVAGASYAWTVDAAGAGVGALGDSAAPQTTFTCAQAGDVQLALTAQLATSPGCAVPSETLALSCCPTDGAFSASAGSLSVPVGSSTSLAATGLAGMFSGWTQDDFVGQTGRGSFEDPNAAATTFRCEAKGEVTLTAVSNAGLDGCASLAHVIVACVDEGTRPDVSPRCQPSLSLVNAALPAFEALGLIPGVDAAITPTAVSSDGKTVVGTAAVADLTFPFSWNARAGGFVRLDGGQVTSVNGDGSVIVGSQATGLGSTLARWTRGTPERFGSGVGHVGVATDVSDDGAVMVGFEDGFADLGGVVWSGACGLQFLPSVERQPIHPTAISHDGGTVVGYVDYDSDNRIAVRWRADTGAEILALDIDGSEVAYLATPADVASDGSVVGTVLRQTSDGGYTSRAVRWTPDHGIVHLDPAASPTGVAVVFAASADGRIVLGDQGIWDEAHGWRDVATVVAEAGGSFEGWQLGAALAVSANGKTIVGNGVCDGKTLAWLARLK